MSRFVASVNIFAESTQISSVIAALSKLEHIEEVYEVAGEYDIVTLVCTSTLEEFQRSFAKANNKNKRHKKHHNHRNFAAE